MKVLEAIVVKQRSWREAPASKSGYKHRDGSPKGDQVRTIYLNIYIKLKINN